MSTRKVAEVQNVDDNLSRRNACHISALSKTMRETRNIGHKPSAVSSSEDYVTLYDKLSIPALFCGSFIYGIKTHTPTCGRKVAASTPVIELIFIPINFIVYLKSYYEYHSVVFSLSAPLVFAE